MARLYNLARVTTATAGTGTITLGSAVSGFLTFADAGVQNGDVVSYAIKDGSNSEVGTGTYTAAGTTLTRSVVTSTNSNNAINLSGSAEVFITAIASSYLDVDNLTEETTAALDDTIPAYDTSASGHRKFQWSNVFKLFNGFTEKTTPLVTDFVGGYSTADSAARKFSLENIFKAINGLTADTAPVAGDLLATYDTSASAPKKVDVKLIGTGKHTIWVPASGMTSRTTNGAASGSTELATNDIMLATKDFDASTEEGVGFFLAMPKGWNESTVTFKPFWTAASGSGGVVWGAAARAFSDDDALDQAVGTQQTSTDTLLAANDMHIGPESSAITIAGSPAEGDAVYFEITREVGDASDTLAVDAKLIGVHVYLTTNANTDD